MDRSNIVKIGLITAVIVIVVGVTFIYGNSQRDKQKSAGQPNQLPTIQNNPQSKTTPANESASKPQQNSSASQPANNSTPPLSTSQPGSTAPAKPSLPATAQTPATGAADTIFISTILGLLTGLYIVTKRRKHQPIKTLQKPANQI